MVFISRLRALWARRRLDEEFDREIEAHLDLLTAEYLRQGMPPADARRIARVKFGSATEVRETHREQRGFPFLDTLGHDVRFAARLLAKDRWFTVVAVAVLALGIGANHTMFRLLYAYGLRGLPIDRPDRVMYLATRDDRGRERGVSSRDFEDARGSATSFTGMAAFLGTPMVVGDEDRAPDRFQGMYISANAFALLGERPLLGRDFLPEDDRPGAPTVVILGHGVWRDRYGGDRTVVGRTIRINTIPAVVIGVMPEGFKFPNYTDLWQPLALMPGLASQGRDARTLGAFARLTDGAAVAQARAEMDAIAARLSNDHPETNRGIHTTVVPINERYNVDLTHPAWLAFMTAAGLIVVIACANVANLLLARSVHRAREIAIRASLGATRRRVVRQLLIESALLATLGGVVGSGVALLGLRILTNAMPETAVPYSGFGMDGWVLAALVSVCLGTVLVFGLVPALHISKTHVNELMKDGGRAVTGGVRARRWTTAFLTVEFGLTMILLTGVVGSVRYARAAQQADLVIDTSPLLTAWVTLPSEKYPTAEERTLVYRRLEERLSGMGVVSSVTLASALPFSPASPRQLAIDGRPLIPGETAPTVQTLSVGDRFFETIGVRLVRGRTFTDVDGTPGHDSVIVNQRLVEMHFGSEDPIGKRILLTAENQSGPAWAGTLVGISPTVRQRTGPQPDPMVYLPYRATRPPTMVLMVRGPSEPGALTSMLREEVRALDSDVPLYRIMTMDQAVSLARWNPRVSSMIITALASIALLLSTVGLYAVTAHAVMQRTQEIGIRIALGAQRWEVRWLVFRRAMWQLGIAIVAGVACTVVWDRLFGDLATAVDLTLVAALLVAVATAACLAPVRRAMRVDPVAALRHE